MQSDYLTSFPLNIDDYMVDHSHESFSLADVLADETVGAPEFDMFFDDLSDRMGELLENLSDQESMIIYWRHHDGITFKEIANRLELGTSRVSQIYDNIVQKLRTALV
jgi:RNA polymerase sigma factor (sigma-70 family)